MEIPINYSKGKQVDFIQKFTNKLNKQLSMLVVLTKMKKT